MTSETEVLANVVRHLERLGIPYMVTRGVVELRGADLDREYVERWAVELGVLDMWRRITSA